MTAAAQAGAGASTASRPPPVLRCPRSWAVRRSRLRREVPGPARRSCARRPTVPTSPGCSPSRTPTTCSPRAPCGPRSCASPRTAWCSRSRRYTRGAASARPSATRSTRTGCARLLADGCTVVFQGLHRAWPRGGRPGRHADRRAGPPGAGERVPHPAGRPRLRGALRHPRRLRRADRRRQALAGAPSGRRRHRPPTTSGPGTRKRSPRPPPARRRWTVCSPPVTSCTCRAAGSTPPRPRRPCRCT